MKTFSGDLRLRSEAINLLEAIRCRAIPCARSLRLIVAEQPQALHLVETIETELANAANGLRMALKDRSRRRRANVAGDGTAAARILADLDRRLSRTGAPEVTR